MQLLGMWSSFHVITKVGLSRPLDGNAISYMYVFNILLNFIDPGNADDVKRSGYDDTLSSSIVHTPSSFDDSTVNIFNSAPGE